MGVGRIAMTMQGALATAAGMHRAGFRRLRIYKYATARYWHFRIGDELAPLAKFADTSTGWEATEWRPR
jgi:hypothetical protein